MRRDSYLEDSCSARSSSNIVVNNAAPTLAEMTTAECRNVYDMFSFDREPLPELSVRKSAHFALKFFWEEE